MNAGPDLTVHLRLVPARQASIALREQGTTILRLFEDAVEQTAFSLLRVLCHRLTREELDGRV
jgi:hypothetical protein